MTQIIEATEKIFGDKVLTETLTKVGAGIPSAEIESVEKCPKCQALLLPLNYAYSSGITIDRCPKGHGLWFDAGELDQAQSYAEHNTKQLKFKGTGCNETAHL